MVCCLSTLAETQLVRCVGFTPDLNWISRLSKIPAKSFPKLLATAMHVKTC